jgi:predicted ATPase/DNA-binding SARP family transcriptional activator
VEVRLLGPLEVLDDAGRPAEVRGTRSKGVLAVLALRAGEVVSAGRIVEEVWGEQEIRDPLNAVQVLVSKLRRMLHGVPGRNGGQLIATTATGYRLDVAVEAIDAVRFDRLAAEGRRLLAAGEAAAAAEALRGALDLWRGPPLVDFEDDFLRGERTRLEESYASTLELRIDADLALGRHEQVGAELASLTEEHPLRERLRAQHMLALYRSGRQAEALRAYQTARTTLLEGLGLEPGPELRRLEAAILAGDPELDLRRDQTSRAPIAEPTHRRGNLPAPLSSFVGRRDELDRVAQLLRSSRLVTLVGPGGAGKTRLAVEVATRVASDHPEGAWLVELAPLRDAVNVAPTVASALDVDDAARLDRFVADKALLLVIDNCEHVLDAATNVVERLLQAGPQVRVLATSREHLGLPGEAVWAVPPLAPSDASTLFVDRAHSDSSDVSQHQAALIDRICARLDGLPLAVELAAARTRSLSLADIEERIDDRFRLLTTGSRTAHPRQQTLRGVIDWSSDLLFADEQRVFRRLSVFAGGFDLHAAEAVCGGDDVAAADILDVVARLVDKSLVSVAGRDDGTRYRLLETLAEYARTRLVEAGEEEATRDRHLRWMIGFAADAEPGLRSRDQARWIRRLGAELDNARAALQWAVHRGSAADAVALAGGMAYGWYITGTVQEGQAFIARALAQRGETSAEHRAIAGAWGGWLTQIGSGATADAVDYCEQAVATARGRSPRGFCIAAAVASLLRAYRGSTVEATELIDEAVAVLAEIPDLWSQAYVDWVRSGLTLKLGDVERATELLHSSVAAFSAAGDHYGEAIASIRLGELAELRGDYDEAITATTFAYEGTMSTGRGANASILATRLGNLAALQGRFDDAASWHATALSRARELSFPGPAAQALSGMGVAAAQQGNLDEAEALHRDALAAYDAVGSVEGAAFALASLGFLATDRGDLTAAANLHRQSLAKAVLGSDRRAIALAVEGLAGVHARAGDGASAARMLGVASHLRGDVVPPPVRSQRTRVEDQARSLIGDPGYDAAHASGRREADALLAQLTAGELLPS